MELRAFVEPQLGATYDQQLAVALAAEETGYDAFFRSDHYLTMGGDGLPGPTDAWVTLAGLARDTTTIRLGTLLSPVTFRPPGPLAVTVAQVDAMSGGRVELGLGAGWYEAEHTAYGLPFPDAPTRFDMLEEQAAVVTGLLEAPPGGPFTFEGTHYRVLDSPALPKPVQAPRPPLIMGGLGARRTPALAARYADEFNVPFAPVERTREQLARVARACEAVGRDPATMRRSCAQVACIGRDDGEVRRRAAAIGRPLDDLRAEGMAGTPHECLERLDRLAAAGVERLYLQFLDIDDLEHVALAAEVLADA